MTGVPGTVGRSDWTLPRAPGRLRTTPRRRSEAFTVPPLALRAIPFFTLAFLASAHWVALVEPAQTRRALVASLIATGAGVLIGLTGRLPRVAGLAARVLVIAVALVLAATAIGIRFKLLMPAGWGTLGDRLSGGLSVVGTVTKWPYAGPNVWLRLTALLGAPVVLVPAAALAFWPSSGRRSSLGSGGALVLLVALYGVAVAARPFHDQGLRGLALLGCLAAWLWMPRLSGRDASAAVVAVGIAALVALVLTPRLASVDPWIDYRHWSWNLHNEKTISYDWRQTYGPLHWPRKNTTLLLIKSKEPEYWKAESLDQFDGVRWTTPPAAQRDPTVDDREITERPKWIHNASVTVRGLKSQLVIAPGQILSLHGLKGHPIYLANGAYLLDGDLSSGDTYTVRSYTPDPSAREMRAAPPAEEFFSRYTGLALPDSAGPGVRTLRVPLRREPGSGDPGAAAVLAGSRYARVYGLAKRITAGATTDYDMVRRIGAYLDSHYTYSEHVPKHQYPLESFLFQDKRGYCQQFSGSAALMLRMLGVPTRVASGFAPGSRDPDTKEYVVRDLDAHAWIEVWFQGLGWVPFDPTPALAPAASQAASFALSEVAASAARGDARDRLPKKRLDALLGDSASGHGGGAAAKRDGGTPWGWIILGLVAGGLALAALIAGIGRTRPRRGASPAPCGDPGIDHLVTLLARMGLEIPPGTTLLELEQRIRRLGGPEAALYARQLRRRRYAAAKDPEPDRWERRKMRIALASAAGAGPVTRMHMALPMARPGRRVHGAPDSGLA